MTCITQYGAVLVNVVHVELMIGFFVLFVGLDISHVGEMLNIFYVTYGRRLAALFSIRDTLEKCALPTACLLSTTKKIQQTCWNEKSFLLVQL